MHTINLKRSSTFLSSNRFPELHHADVFSSFKMKWLPAAYNYRQFTKNVLNLSQPKLQFFICLSESESKNKNLLFNDTTRIRMTNRPSIKEAFQPKSALGRRGISQSFKERVGTPSRPKDPPPPPPQSRLMRSVSNGKIIYDIAEESLVETSAAEPGLVILHTNSENR